MHECKESDLYSGKTNTIVINPKCALALGEAERLKIKKMIKNYYYLVAGILAILFSISHAWNGQTTVLPSINVDTVTSDTKTMFFYVWHIITAENLLFGVAFLFMSVHKDLSKVRFAAWMIAGIMVVRWLIIFGSTLFKNINELNGIITDTIAIIIYVGLIIFGTRVKEKTLVI